MTGMDGRESDAFARRRLLLKHLADQIGAILEVRASHALRALVPMIHTIIEVAPARYLSSVNLRAKSPG